MRGHNIRRGGSAGGLQLPTPRAAENQAACVSLRERGGRLL